MYFKFRAVKSNGEKYQGTRESHDRFSLYAEIKAEGDTLITAEEIYKKSSALLKIDGLINKVPMHQRIIFAKNLGSMLDAGLSLARALTVLEKQVKNSKLKSMPPLRIKNFCQYHFLSKEFSLVSFACSWSPCPASASPAIST
jgi:type II secretory pathway component PulF